MGVGSFFFGRRNPALAGFVDSIGRAIPRFNWFWGLALWPAITVPLAIFAFVLRLSLWMFVAMFWVWYNPITEVILGTVILVSLLPIPGFEATFVGMPVFQQMLLGAGLVVLGSIRLGVIPLIRRMTASSVATGSTTAGEASAPEALSATSATVDSASVEPAAD